ncbi:MAG TPA: ABC transporter substrate-binding protein [Gemmatimonadales bacterium]|nr:ABC transporter substrate-binding protein [Gemmatimonadales bacterium]
MTPRRFKFAFPFTALALGLACAEPPNLRTLTYYFYYDPRSLDPALSTDVPTGEVIALLFDNLTQFNTEGELTPGLAESWAVDRTGLHYTFHLRSNAKFHDGRPVTASQVRASFLRALDPTLKGGRAWPLFPVRGARAYSAGDTTARVGIEVPNDSTLLIDLETPLNIFPKLLAMPVTAVVPTGPVPDLGVRPIGSGPWRFVSWTHDHMLVLARNGDFWGQVPMMDTLRIRIIPEALTQAAEYESGRLSVVEIPFGETRLWEKRRPQELQRRNALRAFYIAINTTRGPLRDVKVRQALNHAVDIPTILANLMGGRGTPAAGALPPQIAGYDPTRQRYSYDPELAKRMLADAGYPQGFSLQLWRSARPEYARVAQAVQQDLLGVGVRVEILERDASSARAAARKGETDLFITDWYGDYPDAENFNYPLFYSGNKGSGGNLAFLADSAVDAMILRARSTTDDAEKVRLDREIDQRVFDLAPWIFCWFPVDLWAERPELTGWRIPAIFNGQRWNTVRRGRQRG